MHATLHRLFLSHPQTVDESYGEHFLFALGFALRCSAPVWRPSCTRDPVPVRDHGEPHDLRNA
jgi:hypothetical protein